MCTPIPRIQGPSGPRLAPVTIEWQRAYENLMRPTNITCISVKCDGMEVGDARNSAVKLCMQHDPRPEFLFFLDYDVIPAWDALKKLIYRARCFPDHDVFCGVYCSKANPPEPLIYNDWGRGPYWDWKVGDLLTTDGHGICGIHMGLTLIRMSLFDRVPWEDSTEPLFLTEQSTQIINGGLSTARGTEDLYFCKNRLLPAQGKILVDTSVLAGHIDNRTGTIYGLPHDSPPVKDSWLAGLGKEQDDATKLAIDLGAGETRRKWDGHQTVTTDIRAGVADYCMDTRELNFPDGHADLVASSHHLEHIPRWEQGRVWSEMFRVLKPGGKIEHVVPSLDWAGFHLFNGTIDEHVYNVLYGAQEAQGYERQWNLHYFGYTKGAAVGLAEAAGFVNVTCEDWRDRDELAYNLIIRGEKPDGGSHPDA